MLSALVKGGTSQGMNHQGSVFLHTGRLLLRPYRYGDEVQMYRNWASDEEVCRHLTWAPHSSLEMTRQVVADWTASAINDRFYHWGITLEEELIGDIAVVNWHEKHREAEIGYCLGKAWWGRGIMPEALTSVIHYLFDTVGFHRVTLSHGADNPASGRVMQKAGLQYEGTQRQAVPRRDGTWGDKALYGAVNGPWQKAQRREVL